MTDHSNIIELVKELCETMQPLEIRLHFRQIAECLFSLDENLKSMEQTNAAALQKLTRLENAITFIKHCAEQSMKRENPRDFEIEGDLREIIVECDAVLFQKSE